MENKSEDWILENLSSEDWGQHLVDFRRWLSQQKKVKGKGTFSDNASKLYANAIRGYLNYVGATLSLTKAQKEALIKIESMPEKDYPFNLRVKEQLMRLANPTEDYIVSAGVSFGLRVGDFVKITRGMLEPLIDEKPPIQLPRIVTKKEGVEAYPFIDRDAKEAIERLLKIMDMEGRTNPDELMLKFEYQGNAGIEVNTILKELFEKAKIPLGEFRVRFHILRKFLTDQLASVCIEDKWKHFVGKKTRSPYVSKEGREAYNRVMEFTNINHKNIAVPDDIRKLNSQIEELRLQVSQKDKRLKSLEEQKIEIERLKSKIFERDTQNEREISELRNQIKEILAKLED